MVGGMDMEQGGVTKEQGEKAQGSYSIIQIILGAIMLWQGNKNRELCPNGAAEYLFIAGILLLVLNLLGIMAQCAQKMAEKDGKITCGEKFGLGLLSFVSAMLWCVDFGLAIWGSIVVFGAYPTWSYEVLAVQTEEFCDYTCFMVAFVLLILRWLIMPFAICCGVMKICCKCCPKGGESS